jgi:hypothetical protein
MTNDSPKETDPMAKGRMLSRDAGRDPKLNSLTLEAHLLYLLAIPLLDRDGLVTGDPALLWADAAPKRHELQDKSAQLINEWVAANLVIRYEWRDGPILYFPGFRKHNASLDYAREPASRFPPPPGFHRTEDGLIPDNPDLAANLAQSFDARNSYAKALAAAAKGRPIGPTPQRRKRETPVKVTGKSPDTSRTFTAEHQDQHQIEHQHQFSDDDARPGALRARRNFDDDGVASQAEEEPETPHTSDAARTALDELAFAWICQLPSHFIAAQRFIADCDDAQLITLLTWLYHWRLAHPDSAAYKKTWENTNNPPGRIIAQVRMGNLAPLEPDDLDDLKQLVNTTIAGVDPSAVLFEE